MAIIAAKYVIEDTNENMEPFNTPDLSATKNRSFSVTYVQKSAGGKKI